MDTYTADCGCVLTPEQDHLPCMICGRCPTHCTCTCLYCGAPLRGADDECPNGCEPERNPAWRFVR